MIDAALCAGCSPVSSMWRLTAEEKPLHTAELETGQPMAFGSYQLQSAF